MTARLEAEILRAAADIAERDHRDWKKLRGKRCAKNDAGPLARELRNKAILRMRDIEKEGSAK